MSRTYLAAIADRARDDSLHRLIARRLVHDGGCWKIEHRGDAGRSLVASRHIPAGTRVFTERPIVVAPGGAVSVAKAALKLDRSGDDFAAVCQLQSRADRHTDGWGPWAAGFASVNVHGAGGTLLDRNAGRRTVLGLLGSMMQHECCPSAITNFGSAEEGTLVSLHTVRDLCPGELISISYCASYMTTARRREQLRKQYGFDCVCRRCTVLPEHVRAFRCPACGEGPCSPASSAPDGRTLVCDACEAEMLLDDEAWAELEAAENSDVVSAEMLEVLHPYHHKPTLMYQANLMKLPPSSRASFLRQHAAARARVYASFCPDDLAHPLVANDIEGAALAHLSGGELDEAAATFVEAAELFEAFYGVGSHDALRCRKATGAATLDEYTRIGGEVHAHH